MPPRPHQRHQTDPGRARNAYVREDRILPHLPALHLLLTGTEPARRRRRRTRAGIDVTHPASVGEAIGYLRDRQITLTYDQDTGTLQAAARETAKTIIGKAS